MKLRKTIAAIAAVALTVSAMSVAVLADVSDTDVSTPNAQTNENSPTAKSGGAGATVDSVKDGTGSAEITTDNDGNTVVNVQLTPTTGSAAGGQPEDGVADARENYHVVIPVDGLTAAGWSFSTDPEDGNQYGYDDTDHKDWNIADGTLKLWLPVANGGTCKVVVVDESGNKKVIIVNTANGTTVVETTSSATEETTTAEETTAATEETTVSEETTVPEETTAAEETDPDDDLPPSAGSLPSLTPGSGSSSAEAAPADAVSSPAEISASKNADVTVNAASEPVSAEMVTAFVNNDAAKTMTLSYGSALKVAVNKEDVTDAETANLDFSVSGENFLSSSDIEDNEVLSEATKIVQIDFVSEGKIDGVDKVTVKSKVGVKLAGKTVTVFEYVDGKLVNLGKTEVTASGYVKFKTDHFGQFVLAVE